MLRLLALLILQLFTAEGFFPETPKMQTMPSDGGDPGRPLFLTPYIEAGNIEEARRLARVTLPPIPFINISSYSGFLTVNKTYNSNLFFWYFNTTIAHSLEPHPNTLFFLQGFPGISSLYGLFEENGPFEIQEVSNKTSLVARMSTYTDSNHVIYIDHTVGAGFSFTNDTRGYCTDQTQVGEQLYAAVYQFYQLFPELLTHSDMSITGELYAGKFATALANTIAHRNPTAKIKIPFARLIIGSGWVDPISQISYHKYLYQMGTHGRLTIEPIEALENNTIDLIKQEKWLEAFYYFKKAIQQMQQMSGNISFYNILKDMVEEQVPKFVELVQTSQFRKYMHVGDMKFQDGEAVRNALKEDFMKSVAPWLSELVLHYNIYFYNGVLGAMVPYTSLTNLMLKLDPIIVNDIPILQCFIELPYLRVIGFLQRGSNFQLGRIAGNLTTVLLLNAGNLACRDNAEWAEGIMSSLTYMDNELPF